MGRFEDCDAGLQEVINDQYGRWGEWAEAAAIAVAETVKLESGTVSHATMLAFTWMNESVFQLDPLPNVNRLPDSPWNWDVGPVQLNLGWTMRMAWQGDIKTEDLRWRDVWGDFYVDGKPASFNGVLITHLRCALRRILAYRADHVRLGYNSADEMRVVRYTGPAAQPHRLSDWRKYEPLFTRFFQCYLS